MTSQEIPVVNVDENGTPLNALQEEVQVDTSNLTLFRPKAGEHFGAAFSMYPLTEQEFTDTMYVRSKNLSNGENNPGGVEVDDFLKAQLDANDPNVFTLMTMPFEEWSVAMESMGFDMSKEALE